MYLLKYDIETYKSILDSYPDIQEEVNHISVEREKMRLLFKHENMLQSEKEN